jgi:hypothetical protein
MFYMSLVNRSLLRRLLKVLFGVLLFWAFFHLVLVILFQPSHEREWELGQEMLPHILFEDDDLVTINSFRNFDWQDDGSAFTQYETRSFSLNDMDSVDVLISHFDDFEGLAHIFLSFGLTTGEQMVVSFETRREVGEEFSPVLGMLRQFEIIYVVGSEEDIVGLRTDVRGERVYLYPTKASPEQAKELFRILAKDINSVYEQPRIYNTLTNNCTNEITRRVEDVTEVRFPLSWKTALPGYFDEILYELNVIDSDASFEVIKARHEINNNLVNRHKETYTFDLRNSSQVE